MPLRPVRPLLAAAVLFLLQTRASIFRLVARSARASCSESRRLSVAVVAAGRRSCATALVNVVLVVAQAWTATHRQQACQHSDVALDFFADREASRRRWIRGVKRSGGAHRGRYCTDARRSSPSSAFSASCSPRRARRPLRVVAPTARVHGKRRAAKGSAKGQQSGETAIPTRRSRARQRGSSTGAESSAAPGAHKAPLRGRRLRRGSGSRRRRRLPLPQLLSAPLLPLVHVLRRLCSLCRCVPHRLLPLLLPGPAQRTGRSTEERR